MTKTMGWLSVTSMLIIVMLGFPYLVMSQEVTETLVPTAIPTETPTLVPTVIPTDIPTLVPTAISTETPTLVPTAIPTGIPTLVPTAIPTGIPTSVPTAIPTDTPPLLSSPTFTATATATLLPTVTETVMLNDTPTLTFTPTIEVTQLSVPPAEMYLNLSASEVAVGTPITAELSAKHLADVYALEISCYMDTHSITHQQSMPGTIFIPNTYMFNDTGLKEDGSQTVGVALLDPAPALNGDGQIMSISLEAVNAGQSQIQCQVVASDSEGNALNLVMIHGDQTINVLGDVTLSPEILTITPIFTLSPTITPTAEVEITTVPETATLDASATRANGGNLTIQGYIVPSKGLQNPIVTIRGTEIEQIIYIDQSWLYVFDNLPSGDYAMSITADHHLERIISITLTDEAKILLPQTLVNGDVDMNGVIDIGDATLLSANYGWNVPPASSMFDLDGNGRIDIFDLAIMGGNFRQSSG
jgi:hypothetical protein